MSDIKVSVDRSERIGVIGSPSSTNELTLDLLGTAVNKRLVGNLAFFAFNQDNTDHYALGQIVQIMLQNVWTQDPTMRGLIRQKGRVDPITERQDTHTAKMTISSVFANEGNTIDQSILGTVPSTGTDIKLLNEEVLNSLLFNFQNELFYLGRAYGTDILLPMWFKHFGSGVMGAQEAYHIGIFGKTGSGKSVLARMIMMAYARHPPMSIFVLDPQGEFSRDIQSDNEVRRIYRQLSREVQIYNHNLVLTGDDLFKKILVSSDFFERIGIIHEGNRIRAANVILNCLKRLGQTQLKDQNVIPPYKAYTREAFDRVWRELHTEDALLKIYTSQDPRERVRSTIEGADADYFYTRWRRITSLFRYEGKAEAIEIRKLVRKIHEQTGQIVIIDLSETNVPEDILWNDSMKLIVIGEFLQRITNEAEYQFRRNNLLNCLVIIDEAHRLAPRERTDNEELERVKESLIDAVRTTRKFGLGWLFISQTLSSLDREIINQTRIYIFGFGLAWGIERQALQEIIEAYGSISDYSGWILFFDCCGDYSGFVGSEHATAEAIIDVYKKRKQIEIREMTIDKNKFLNFIAPRIVSRNRKDIDRTLERDSRDRHLINIIAESRGLITELLAYYTLTKSGQGIVDWNIVQNKEQLDLVLENDNNAVLVECVYNPSTMNVDDDVRKLKGKLNNLKTRKNKEGVFWFWLRPQQKTIDRLHINKIKFVVISEIIRTDPVWKGKRLTKLKTIFNDRSL